MKWPKVPLPKVAIINPRRPRDIKLRDDDPITFVPMPAVSEVTASIEIAEIRPYSEVKKGYTYFEENDVLFAKITPCMENGKSAIATGLCNGVGFGSTEFHVLRAKDNLLIPKFLHYFVRQPSFRNAAKSRMRGAAGQQRVPIDFLDGVVLPLPPPSEQRRIVDILDQADVLRKKRAEADAKATRILPALFYKMFGDPATNPKRWKVTHLGEVILETRNGLYKPAEFYGSGTRILKMFNIQDGELDLTRLDLINVSDHEYATYRLLSGDILLNRVNTPELVGKCAVITEDVGEAVFESKNIRIRLKDEYVTPEYVAAYLNSPFGHSSLRSGVKHAIGMATINNRDLSRTKILLPPLPIQEQWSEVVRRFRKIRKFDVNSRQKLESIFQVLLHRAFTGDLTAQWREAHMKELLEEMEQQVRALGA